MNTDNSVSASTVPPSQYELRLGEKNRQMTSFRRFVSLEGGGHYIKMFLHEDVTAFFLREWIESKWTNGMNWNNYGSYWVIDHIVPFRMFNIFDKKDMILCWDYRNLMPLLYSDNLKKQGNVFFAYELLLPIKDKHLVYSQLFDMVNTEVAWMIKYIEKYHL